MVYGEQIALRGQVEIDDVAAATRLENRSRSDAEFLESLRAGDLEAFDRLINERSGEVFSLLHRLTQDVDEAQDLTQETFLCAFRSIGRFRGDSDIKTWIYRIAVNQARNRWRWWKRRRRDSTVSIDAEIGSAFQTLGSLLRADETTNPELSSMTRERDLALHRALGHLSSSYREAVVLRDIEGMSYEEIAATLNISVGTVKSRLSRGREELRSRLGDTFR